MRVTVPERLTTKYICFNVIATAARATASSKLRSHSGQILAASVYQAAAVLFRMVKAASTPPLSPCFPALYSLALSVRPSSLLSLLSLSPRPPVLLSPRASPLSPSSLSSSFPLGVTFVCTDQQRLCQLESFTTMEDPRCFRSVVLFSSNVYCRNG